MAFLWFFLGAFLGITSTASLLMLYIYLSTNPESKRKLTQSIKKQHGELKAMSRLSKIRKKLEKEGRLEIDDLI